MTATTPPTPHHSRSGTGNKAPSQESLHATVSTVIHATRLTLKQAGIEEAPLEGEVLVRHVAGIDRASLYSDPDRAFSDAEAQQLATLVARRCKREPLPYILGHWEFYGLDYIVTPAVLIPRPETETLVELALICALSGGTKERENESGHPLKIADVGTGSGCVAISLAKRLPQATVIATDLSPDALAVARQNIERHDVANQVHLQEGDLLSGYDGKLDLIVSNPPYIPDGEVPGLQPEVALHEPSAALGGGPDGLSIIRRLMDQAAELLSPNGALMIEFNPPQSSVLMSEAKRLWPNAGCRVVKDLAGLDRVLVVELEGQATA
ncbi:MAG: peptide chain release factor N(5)-glutamine methyltransferase [Chloroflexi bacterium]|nr:peptide chain release factor N(5)-glutamine methyltransferase [Chloroflexota bacterium]